MARQKRVLCDTAETNMGVSYQIGYPVDDAENTDGKIAWGKLVSVKGNGTSVKQYGTDTGMYYIYNNVIGFLCKNYNISNVYQYGSLPKIDSHKSISFWFVIFSILLMLLLAYF